MRDPNRTPIPLSSLLPDLESGWTSRTRWFAAETDRTGLSLRQPAGSSIVFRLNGIPHSRLRARLVMDTSDAGSESGLVRARISLRCRGQQKELWSGVVGSLRGRQLGSPSLELPLPSSEAPFDLILSVSLPRPLRGFLPSVLWLDPVIDVPTVERRSIEAPASRSRTEPEASEERAGSSPLISILAPVHDPDPRFLEEMLRSVHGQRFENWELCLVDDGSSDPAVGRILAREADADERVQLLKHPKPGGISAATNSALELARGEYVALLDHDDELSADALEAVAATIAKQPSADMIYSDEVVFEDEEDLYVFRKPAWSPDLLRSHMYTCHLGVYRRRLAIEAGGFETEFDGAQDYDFVLRFTESTDRIVHIPRVLYRWRRHQGSVADNATAKPHAYMAARRAVTAHLGRTHTNAEAHFDTLRTWYRVGRRPDPAATSALVLPMVDVDEQALEGLRHAAGSWLRTIELPWELVLTGSGAALARCESVLPREIADGRLRSVEAPADLNRGALLNRAIEATDAELLLILDGPVEPLTTSWHSRLAGFAASPEIGAAGAKTLASDGRVEQAGVIFRDGLPSCVQLAAPQGAAGPLGVLQVTANFCAFDGTVAARREMIANVGGFDERFDRLCAVDFSARIWAHGGRVVSVPEAVLRRTPGSSPRNDLSELVEFQASWLRQLEHDPYFGAEVARGLATV
jgi:glycosyltransferase involved in cell wall biosynthesis